MANLLRGIGNAGSLAATGATIGGPVGAAIGGGIGLITGLFGGGDDDAQKRAYEEAMATIDALEIPELDKAIAIQQFSQSGTFSPELLEKIQLNLDKKTLLKEDPQNRAQQQYALNALKELSQTGLSAMDRAQMAEMRSQVAQDQMAATKSALQGAQMRGTLDSGDVLASQLASAQAGTQQASKAAMQQAAAAAQARQNALSQFGSLAGQVRAADVGTEQFNVQNELLRQKFLDENAIGRQSANVQAQNAARMANLQRQQAVSDANIRAANEEAKRQRDAQLQMANLQFQKARMKSGQQSDMGDFYGKRAAQEAGSWKDIISGVGAFAGAGKDLGWWGGKGGVTDLKVGLSDDAKKSWKDLSDNWDSNAATVLPAQFNTSNQQYQYAAHGGRIDGHAKTDGDSYENDTVPTMLSPDEIVVPRSKAQDPKKAKTFIDEIFEQEKLDKKPKKKYDKNESLLDLIAKLHNEKK